MCQDCYGPGSYADDDLGYDDQDDDWGDDGYEPPPSDRDDLDDDDGWQEYKDDLAMGYINPDGSQREPDPPDDPWYGRPLSLRERITWRIRDWRRRRDVKRHPDRYDMEPPF